MIKKAYKAEGRIMRNEDIAKTLGYSRSYFSTLLGDSGKIDQGHINTLKLHFKNVLENQTLNVPRETTQPGKDYKEEVIALLKDKISSMEKQGEMKINLESLKSGLEHELKTNRMLLQVIYEWTEEQRAKEAPPKQQDKKKIDGKTEGDNQKDGTYTRTSKKGM